MDLEKVALLADDEQQNQSGNQTLVKPPSAGRYVESYLGWSTFSLQAFVGRSPSGRTYGWPFMNEANIRQQAAILATEPFKDAGYRYINLDSGWSAEYSDQYGRYVPQSERFPTFVQMVADFAQQGLKTGIYLIPGVFWSDRNDPTKRVKGTNYTIADISLPEQANAFIWSRCKLNHDHPGAYLWTVSMVEALYEMGIKFIKFDALLPGSPGASDNPPPTMTDRDVMAYRRAIDQVFRDKPNEERIWITGSWQLPTDGPWLKFYNQHLDAFRVCQDIESYSDITTSFPNVRRSITKLWNSVKNANKQGFSADGKSPLRVYFDLDSLLVGNGAVSTLTPEQRKTYMAIWVISGGPLYIGDDLTELDPLGFALLTNKSLLQYRQKLMPVNYMTTVMGGQSWSDAQIWYAHHTEDGSTAVAVSNVSIEKDFFSTMPQPVFVLFSRLNMPSIRRKPLYYAVVDLWTDRVITFANNYLIFWIKQSHTKLFKLVPVYYDGSRYSKSALGRP